MKFFLYGGRHGERHLVHATKAGWDFLTSEMQKDNHMSFEEAAREGFDIEGSYDEGFLYMDDGGEIHTIELTEVR